MTISSVIWKPNAPEQGATRFDFPETAFLGCRLPMLVFSHYLTSVYLICCYYVSLKMKSSHVKAQLLIL